MGTNSPLPRSVHLVSSLVTQMAPIDFIPPQQAQDPCPGPGSTNSTRQSVEEEQRSAAGRAEEGNWAPRDSPQKAILCSRMQFPSLSPNLFSKQHEV